MMDSAVVRAPLYFVPEFDLGYPGELLVSGVHMRATENAAIMVRLRNRHVVVRHSRPISTPLKVLDDAHLATVEPARRELFDDPFE